MRDRELAFYRSLDTIRASLAPMRDPRKALRYALRAVGDVFGAPAGVTAVLRAGEERVTVLHAYPKRTDFDLELLTRFARVERPEVPEGILLVPVRRWSRPWGIIGFRRPAQPFDRTDRDYAQRLGELIAESILHMDRERMVDVRDRIDRKIMERLRPVDLFYQILDGLRTLTRYDHSSAILIRDNGEGHFRLVAEQIAWDKLKSDRIGLELPASDAVRGIMAADDVHGFDRRPDGWAEWTGRPVGCVAEWLDYNTDGLCEGAMIAAPLAGRGGVFGVLKIAARHPGQFGPYDLELVERFRSQAAIAIQNSQRAESLHSRMLDAEKKHAMADLARGVSHDVNNALGAVLPIVQQMQADIRSGGADPSVFRDDLEQIHKSLQVCRRIFGGMVAFARGRVRETGHGDLRRAIDGTLAILRDSLERRAIRLEMEVPEGLPALSGSQNNIEQITLNLVTNARDAMPDGGVLAIAAEAAGGGVRLVIRDTGVGMTPEQLVQIQEAFYTTKSGGSGLGLSICRSLVWEMGGSMRFDSAPGRGTTVTVTLPGLKTEGGAPS